MVLGEWFPGYWWLYNILFCEAKKQSCLLKTLLSTFQKWNECGFRPPLCTYKLNWARRTSWGLWDDNTLQTQDSKFEPWRSEAEHATSQSGRLPTIFNLLRVSSFQDGGVTSLYECAIWRITIVHIPKFLNHTFCFIIQWTIQCI